MNFPVEHLAREELKRLQSERLVDQVRYLEKRSAFYREKFKAAGVSSKEIRSIEDIRKLPITYSQDLRDHYPMGLFTVPKTEIQRIHCSSGSTGIPKVIGYTRGDMEIWAEVVARSLNAAGARPGMMLHNAYGYGLFTGGLGLHQGAERLGMTVLPVSGGGTVRQVDLIRDLKPDVICCSPSYALTLADEMAKRGMAPEECSLQYAVLGSEAWTEAIRDHIESRLGVEATNIYGLSEIIGPGVSNEEYTEKGGAYIWEDHFYPEILDAKTKEPVAFGKQGVLVLTTLTKKGMPLLRYWTNDITSLYYDPESNRNMVKMNPIVGRADDMLIIRGVNVYPSQIEAVFQYVEGILPNYYLTPIEQQAMNIRLEVDVEVAHAYVQKHAPQKSVELLYQELAEAVQTEIKKRVGVRVHVQIHPEDELPKNTGGKINRILKRKQMSAMRAGTAD